MFNEITPFTNLSWPCMGEVYCWSFFVIDRDVLVDFWFSSCYGKQHFDWTEPCLSTTCARNKYIITVLRKSSRPAGSRETLLVSAAVTTWVLDACQSWGQCCLHLEDLSNLSWTCYSWWNSQIPAMCHANSHYAYLTLDEAGDKTSNPNWRLTIPASWNMNHPVEICWEPPIPNGL